MRYPSLAMLPLLTLAACSSITEGRHQEIAIETTPAGASCTLERNGKTIGRIDPTPGAVVIEKTKYDMVVNCTKKGYPKFTYLNKSGVAGATFGNIIAGGGIGWAVDSATGADNKYSSPMLIDLKTGKVTLPENEKKEEAEESPATKRLR